MPDLFRGPPCRASISCAPPAGPRAVRWTPEQVRGDDSAPGLSGSRSVLYGRRDSDATARWRDAAPVIGGSEVYEVYAKAAPTWLPARVADAPHAGGRKLGLRQWQRAGAKSGGKERGGNAGDTERHSAEYQQQRIRPALGFGDRTVDRHHLRTLPRRVQYDGHRTCSSVRWVRRSSNSAW